MTLEPRHYLDPIHRVVAMSDAERRVMDTFVFQRLRAISQLAMVYRVYPGARHSRFEHSLGAMHLAGRVFDQLDHPLRGDVRLRTVFRLDEEDAARYRRTFRLGAMLHDLGHGPFSHPAEGLLPPGLHHEHFTVRLLRGFGDLQEALVAAEVDPEEVVLVAVEPKEGMDLRVELNKPLLQLLNNLVTGELGVDRMDYLLRDSHQCGVRYGVFDVERLIGTMRVVTQDEAVPVAGIDADGIAAAEALTFARFQMFMSVYHHKTVDILNWHLSRFMLAALPGGQLPAEAGAYSALTDAEILARMHRSVQDPKQPGHVHAAALLLRRHLRPVWNASNKLLETLPNLRGLLRESIVARFGYREEQDFVILTPDHASGSCPPMAASPIV